MGLAMILHVFTVLIIMTAGCRNTMNDDAPVIYGLEFQARALCTQLGETDAIRFLIGTQSLRTTNQVHLIDFDDENNIVNKYVFLFEPGEIWNINANPNDKNILGTCYNTIENNKVTTKSALWRIPPIDDLEPPVISDVQGSQKNSLQRLKDLDASHGDVKKIMWNPSSDNDKILTISERFIDIWLNVNNDIELNDSIAFEGKEQLQFNVGRFNPHHGGSQIAAGIDNTIKGYDLRSMSSTFTIRNAHAQTVRDLDFNPNKQYYFGSCSDDCKVKFWDTRNTSEPLLVRSDHSHWIWSIRYNNFHDQLVLTSSSDSRVILSNIASLSSEPFGHIDEDEDLNSREPDTDRVISFFEEHEDSVYAVEWSGADPWIFASLSYDGRVVINRVPRAEKYKTLL